MTDSIESGWAKLEAFELLFPLEFDGIKSNVKIDTAQRNRQQLLSLILGNSTEVTIALPDRAVLQVSELRLVGGTLEFR